jgi:dTDP-4-dehydrorhamnose reductase
LQILVLGLGQLGRDLIRVLDTSHLVSGVNHAETNIASLESVEKLLRLHAPDFVINAAAYTDVEGAESDREGAFAVNATGAKNVALATASQGIPIVHYSTDFVFDGKKSTPYSPDDPTNPLSVYGASKLAGERAVIEANPAHFILRTAWLYGPSGNNFIEKIIGWATANDSIRVVTDELGSPTQTWDLAQATAHLMQTQAYGLYHGVNRGVCSRFELARAIVDKMNLTVELNKCLSSEFPMKAERPAYSVLDSSSLEAACDFEMRSWEDALDHYIARREALMEKG